MYETPLKLQASPSGCATLALALALLCQGANAGRPLGTDDAQVSETGKCQIEAWGESRAKHQSLVLSPACGIASGLELGLEWHRHPDEGIRADGGLGLKYAPEQWQHSTPLGTLSLGLKTWVAFDRPEAHGWHRSALAIKGLASLDVNPVWALLLNLGMQKDRESGRSAANAAAALTAKPSERSLVFAEVQGSRKSALFGSPTRTVGALWWLQPDRFGLSMSAGRNSGNPSTLWTFGIGYYGF